MTDKGNYLHNELRNLINNLSPDRMYEYKETILKVYDTNKNSIFDTNEISQIKSDFESGMLDELLNFSSDAKNDHSLTSAAEELEYTKENSLNIARKCKEKGYFVFFDMSQETFNVIDKYHIEKYNQKFLAYNQNLSREILNLQEDGIKQFEELLKISIKGKQLSIDTICKLIGIDVDKRNKAIEILQDFPDINFRIVEDIINLENLSYTDLKNRANDVYQRYSDSIQDRIICEIQKEKLFSGNNHPKLDIPNNEIVSIDPHPSKDFVTIVQITSDSKRNEYDVDPSNGNIIETRLACNTVQKYDKTKRIEHQTKLHISQKYQPHKDLRVIEDVIRYYNKEGEVIQTVNFAPSSSPNSYNISITDKNGKQHPIQCTSYNEETGTTFVQKDFKSPNGYRTRYYMEENENLKVTEYKITNKFGKVLMDRRQTFQKVSDNEFITSVNNDVYRTVFSENSIVITETKTGKTKTIKLNELIKSGKETFINILKQVPANLLVHISDYMELKYSPIYHKGNASSNADGIIFGDFGDFYSGSLSGIFIHEFGHYLGDRYIEDNTKSNPHMSKNKKKHTVNSMIREYAKKKYKKIEKSMSDMQQQIWEHYNDDSSELFADAVSILNNGTVEFVNARTTYLQWKLPEVIAKSAKIIDKIKIDWEE